jgi:YggT family protein
VIVHVIYLIVEIYLFILIARIILSWFPTSPGTPLASVTRALGYVTDPLLNPLRKVLPPLTVGGMGIDLSPIILCVILEIVLQIIA